MKNVRNVHHIRKSHKPKNKKKRNKPLIYKAQQKQQQQLSEKNKTEAVEKCCPLKSDKTNYYN